MQNSLFF